METLKLNEPIKKTKILVCGDSLDQATGLAYVASVLIMMLDKTGQYEISYATIAGKDTTPEGLVAQGPEFVKIMQGKRIANVQINNKEKAIQMEKVIEEVAPEIVLSIHDPWYFDTIAFSSYRDSFYWACYVTVEVPVYPNVVMSRSPYMKGDRKPIRDILSRADIVIPVTSVGQTMFEEHMKLTNVSEYCYLGLDYENRCKEPITKAEAFGEANEDDFIFMTMGFNSERKRMDRVFESFYKFKKKMKDGHKYKMYVHTDFNAPTGGTDLSTLAADLDLLPNILIPRGYFAGKGVDKSLLYKRYKACDAYIGLPSGEGFGYGFAESMMHGKPVIYPDYGGHVCYCRDRGLPVRISDYIYSKYAAMKWALADTDDAARAMSKIVSDKRAYARLAQVGEEFVRTQLDWPIVFEHFHSILKKAYRPNNISILAGIPMKRLV